MQSSNVHLFLHLKQFFILLLGHLYSKLQFRRLFHLLEQRNRAQKILSEGWSLDPCRTLSRRLELQHFSPTKLSLTSRLSFDHAVFASFGKQFGRTFACLCLFFLCLEDSGLHVLAHFLLLNLTEGNLAGFSLLLPGGALVVGKKRLIQPFYLTFLQETLRGLFPKVGLGLDDAFRLGPLGKKDSPFQFEFNHVKYRDVFVEGVLPVVLVELSYPDLQIFPELVNFWS